jgi:hypothetical protein
MAALGDRLIKGMSVIGALMGLGAVAAAVMGIGNQPGLFVVAFVVLGVSSQAGGLIRGRLDVYHPVPAAAKPVRDTRYETAFKVSAAVPRPHHRRCLGGRRAGDHRGVRADDGGHGCISNSHQEPRLPMVRDIVYDSSIRCDLMFPRSTRHRRSRADLYR